MRKFTFPALGLLLVGCGSTTTPAGHPDGVKTASPALDGRWSGPLADHDGQADQLRLHLTVRAGQVSGTAYVPAQVLVSETAFQVTGQLNGAAARLSLLRASGTEGYLLTCLWKNEWQCSLQSSSTAVDPASGTAVSAARTVNVVLRRE